MNKNGERNVTRVYTDRWWMLSTVLLLNFANYSHWVAFASVTKNSAKYYDQTGDRIDLITIVSYALGIPCCILSAYAVETWGLKISLKFGGIMTGIGKIKVISFPTFNNFLNVLIFHISIMTNTSNIINCRGWVMLYEFVSIRLGLKRSTERRCKILLSSFRTSNHWNRMSICQQCSNKGSS